MKPGDISIGVTTYGGMNMEWILRDGPVYLVVIGVVGFIVFVALQSRKENKDDKPKT